MLRKLNMKPRHVDQASPDCYGQGKRPPSTVLTGDRVTPTSRFPCYYLAGLIVTTSSWRYLVSRLNLRSATSSTSVH